VAVFRDAACCGLPPWCPGTAGPPRVRRENVRRLRDADPRAIVFPCGSCLSCSNGTCFPDPKGIPRMSRGVRRGGARGTTELLLTRGFSTASRTPPPGQNVARSATTTRATWSGTLGKGPEAREVLSRAVAPGVRRDAGADLCCGYGGTFNVRDYPTSSRIGESKVTVAARGGTRVISTACSGCVLQMRDMAARPTPPFAWSTSPNWSAGPVPEVTEPRIR